MFTATAVLFLVLVGFTSYWTFFDAGELRDHSENRRALLEQQLIPRGLISDASGTFVARNVQRRAGTQTFFTRTYPTDSLFSSAIGYSFIELGNTGIEQYYNGDLTGQESEFADIFNRLRGARPEGDDLKTSLNQQAQKTAFAGLAGRPGAAVALDTRTGAVKVMASVPSYDPNNLPRRFARLNKEPSSPLVNRPTQAQYPPGSAFKVVTVAAAIDSGEFSPDSVIDGSSPQTFATQPLKNFANENFPRIKLSEALVHSVNTAFANVAVKLNKKTLLKYMRRFGFGSRPAIDLPSQELAVSGIYRKGKLLGDDDVIDVGRVGIGQGDVLLTPLQMAMVGQTIANRGTQLDPYLVSRVSDRDGRTVSERKPRKRMQVVKPSSAAQVRDMMVQVVERGTGVAAQMPGIKVAGKTGTAQIDIARDLTQAWFLEFAPAYNPRYVVAVTVERTTGQSGTGGQVAAPIAKQIMEKLL